MTTPAVKWIVDDELVRKSTSLIDELRTQGHNPPEIVDIMVAALTILTRFCGLDGIEQTAETIRRGMIDMDKHFARTNPFQKTPTTSSKH